MNPFESLITTVENEALSALAGVDSAIVGGLTATDSGITQGLKSVDSAIETAIKTALAPLAFNAGPLAVGIGLFLLGASMVVFAFGEDVVDVMNQAQKVAAKLPPLVAE